MPTTIAHPSVTSSDRNSFLLFRRRFELSDLADANLSISEFQIFADTRYRLIVNDSIVGYGPTRFYPDYPEFDSYEIAPYLKNGVNEIRVEVNSRNASSFQAVPSQLGFWAAGKISEINLDTPGDWEVKISQARSAQAPTFSFAQGPVEIVDVQLLETEWKEEAGWGNPMTISGWGELLPRSLPQPAFNIRSGGKLVLNAPLKDEEERLIFHRSFPPLDSKAGHPKSTQTFAVALDLYSPHQQDVELGLFWGDNYLNGELLSLENDAVRGNRQNTIAPFKEGWNLFYAQIAVIQPSWGFTIGWPRISGLQVASTGLRVSEAMSLEALAELRGAMPLAVSDLENVTWLQPVDEGPNSSFPAREVSWNIVDESRKKTEDGADRLLVEESGGAGVVLWDFEREYLGHIRLEIEAQKLTVIDIVGDERRRSDGLLSIYSSNPFVNSADRFIIPAGKSIIEGFHPRGGRYVQITARSEGSVKLKNIEERSALLHLEQEGHFECNDPLLNNIWRTGLATIDACLPDVWVDCPWREQGAYLGDTLVEYRSTRAFSSNQEVGRRALRLWSQGQRSDGLLPACVPAWYTVSHADFSLMYVLLLRDFWADTGEIELVRELWPTVLRIFNSGNWEKDETGLWNGTPDLRLFFDWGIPADERLGKSNGALNALRVGALKAAGELAAALGEDSISWKREAEEVAAVFRRFLWRDERQNFAPFVGNNDAPAYHANLLALRFGIATPDQKSGVIRNLRNAHNIIEDVGNIKTKTGHLELFFTHFVLEALSSNDLHEDAINWIRDAWSPMIRAGAVTFWECLYTGMRQQGSSCHAWSSSPVWYFMREILGVRPVDGQPDSFQIIPNPSGLNWARGAYPHSRGRIEVSWEKINGELKLDVQAPEGVTIEIAR
jgi:hypothetical protein